MCTITLQLPESLHEQLKTIAEQEGISIDHFIATAVAEKVLALTTAEYREQRAARGDRDRFDRVLGKVRDVPAAEQDKMAAD